MFLFCMDRTSVVIIFVFMQITGSLEKVCVVYSGGNYVSSVCNNCCGNGKLRMCCSDKVEKRQREVNAIIVMIGCITGVALIGGMLAGLFVIGKRRTRTDPCPTGPTGNHPADVRANQLNPLASLPPGKTRDLPSSSWV